MKGSWYIPWIRLIMHNEKSVKSELKTIVNRYPKGVFRGGAMGAKPPPGTVKSINFRWFSGPNGCWAPPWKVKKFKPPRGQIPEYTPLLIPIAKSLYSLWICLILSLIVCKNSRLLTGCSVRFKLICRFI